MTDDELLALASDVENTFARRARAMEDFRYDERQEKYWDVTTGTLLGAKSVDGAIPKDKWPTKVANKKGDLKPYNPSIAINDVSTGLTVEGSTWWAGHDKFIRDMIVDDRGIRKVKGAVCYNTYCGPSLDLLVKGDDPQPWIDHVKTLWPDPVEHEHFFDYAAHMMQKPHEKVNHGIVMAGAQGIGKDTALLPLRKGVGEHNTAEISPDDVAKPYNPYVKSVLLIVNEVRPHDADHKASAFYDQLKPLMAAPPEMLPMEIKYANVVYVRNLMHVVLTTNDPLKMYIPEEDRRLFVMTSKLAGPKVFPPDYFEKMYAYLQNGGLYAAVKWLHARDLSKFVAGAPPKSTWGKQAIINSADEVRRSFADEIISKFLAERNEPQVVFPKDILDWLAAGNWFDDLEAAQSAVKAKNFHYKMESFGYDLVRNANASEWSKGKFRSRSAYIKKEIPFQNQQSAVEAALEKRA